MTAASRNPRWPGRPLNSAQCIVRADGVTESRIASPVASSLTSSPSAVTANQTSPTP
jgi:hypothetical protein